MKRRVVQGKENKRTHRALHAAFGASPPYMVVVDSTTARAWSGLKGNTVPLPDMVEKGLEAEVELRCVPATRRVARGMGSEVLAGLHGCGLYTVGGTSEDQNEHKAIVAALQAPRTSKFPVVFLLTLSHDLRRLASRVPHTAFINFSVRERRMLFDAESVTGLKSETSNAAPDATDATKLAGGMSAADAAFMRKLAADRVIKDSALPAAALRPVKKPDAAAAPELTKAEAAAIAAKQAVQEKRRRNEKAKKAHANPLSCKKKQQKLVIRASKPAD